MREKLLELIGRVQDEGRDYSDVVCSYPTSNEKLADYLIANDVVQVVRCKDCKHFVTPQGVPCCDNYFGLGFPHPSGYDFCSYGERRT